MKGKGKALGLRKVLLRFLFFVFLNYADVENSESLRVFSYIYIINIFKNMNLIEKIKKNVLTNKKFPIMRKDMVGGTENEMNYCEMGQKKLGYMPFPGYDIFAALFIYLPDIFAT